MFDYYLVLGVSFEPYKHLQTAIELIRRRFDIAQISKYYIGPSEDPLIDNQFINVSIHLRSKVSVEKLQSDLKTIELAQLYDGVKVVDIDLVLQMNNDQAIFISDKIHLYCHCLVTLKDICPLIKYDDQSIFERYNNNPKASSFIEV